MHSRCRSRLAGPGRAAAGRRGHIPARPDRSRDISWTLLRNPTSVKAGGRQGPRAPAQLPPGPRFWGLKTDASPECNPAPAIQPIVLRTVAAPRNSVCTWGGARQAPFSPSHVPSTKSPPRPARALARGETSMGCRGGRGQCPAPGIKLLILTPHITDELINKNLIIMCEAKLNCLSLT